jgi:hypothetical protein
MRGGLAAEVTLRPVRRAAPTVLEQESFLVGLLALLGLALVVVAPRTFVQDSWMTLVSGREVAEHGIPHTETLTTLAHGRRWVDQQWLAQLVFFDAWRIGGLKLVALLHAALIETAIVLGVVAARARGASPRTSASAALLTFLLAPWLIQLRAQSFALVLFVLLYWLLSRDSRTPSARVLLVLPILALWANMHGSVVLGAVLVEVRALTTIFRARPRQRTEAVRTIALLVGAPLAVIASPYGLSLVHYYKLMLLSAPFAPYITEWKPTSFGALTEGFFVVLLILAILIGRFPRRLSAFEHAALAVLVAASLQAERNIVWFALAVVVSAPVLFDEIAQRDAPPSAGARRWNLVVAGIASAMVLVIAATPLGGHGVTGEPVRAGDRIASLVKHNPTLRVFPTDATADWLLWRYPELTGKVAYDVRFELLTAGELDQLFRLRTDDRFDLPLTHGYRIFVVNGSDERATRSLLLHGGRLVTHSDDVNVVLRLA